jgi:ribonuclease HI
MKARMTFDGGSRGNPGPSAAAAVIERDNRKPIAVAKFIGKKTNNEAEYLALHLGLKKAAELGVKEIDIYGDSNLIVNHVNGTWRCMSHELYLLLNDCRIALQMFDKWTLSHIPRAKNTDADLLVNACLDQNHAFRQSR